MNYLDTFREMISLRGLTDHTVKSYSTYIRAYLEYLEMLGTDPQDASWDHMRDFIKWLQTSRDLSDRTINMTISQLRFFHMYVLHKQWDNTQLPRRKFDQYLPFVPSREDTIHLRDGEILHLPVSSSPSVRPVSIAGDALSRVAAPLEIINICFSRFVWSLFLLTPSFHRSLDATLNVTVFTYLEIPGCFELKESRISR